jgi:hypothetical protein
VKFSSAAEERIREAMKHPDELGAGAKKRRKLKPKERFSAVMREWKRGTLNSGSGHKVKSYAQAVAVASSESKRRS